MSVADAVETLKQELEIESGCSDPLKAITVSERVFDKLCDEIHGACKYVGRESFSFAEQLTIHGVQIFRGLE